MPKEKAQVVQELSRRREILQAAIEAFSRHGYHGASMEDIARVVGVRKAALYYYFPSKQELLFAILDEFTGAMIEGLEKIHASPSGPVEKLRQAFHYHIEALAKRTDEFTVLTETGRLKGRWRKQVIARRDRYEGVIRKMIQDGVDSGELRVVDAKYAALSFLGVVNWMYQWYRAGELPPEELARLFWDLTYRGLGAASESPVG
ncbi:MAG TPA: TetR/AcrR family transcriptional regulator [Dehalococcoidia bacterium]|nr:TetR/AcrR family transcriptional regulator [Dehalococcoidia bacterium]